MAINSKNKVPEFSIEQEQNEFAASTEREKIKGSKNLNVPPLRFPEFTDEWTKSTIGDCFELYSGNTPSRLDKKNFSGEINWITSGELKEHYIGETKEHISEEVVKENNLKLIPVGTFVIAIYGLEAEGVRGTGSITMQKSTISQACMAFTPTSMITNEFLYSWYKKHGNAIGIKYAQGTKQQNLCYEIIEKFKIQYPSLKEQEKLNHFISLLDERIATQSRIIDKLQSLIKGLNDSFHNIEEGDLISFDEIGRAYSGLTGKSGDDFGHGSPYITYLNVFQNNIVDEGQTGLVSVDANENQNTVSYGDVLFTLSSETPEETGIGCVYLGQADKYYLNSFCFGITITKPNKVYQPYLAHLVSSLKFRKFVYPLAQGSTRFNLQKNDFMRKKFMLLPFEKQKEISTILDTLHNRLSAECKFIDLYRKQKAYLLHNLFI